MSSFRPTWWCLLGRGMGRWGWPPRAQGWIFWGVASSSLGKPLGEEAEGQTRPPETGTLFWCLCWGTAWCTCKNKQSGEKGAGHAKTLVYNTFSFTKMNEKEFHIFISEFHTSTYWNVSSDYPESVHIIKRQREFFSFYYAELMMGSVRLKRLIK